MTSSKKNPSANANAGTTSPGWFSYYFGYVTNTRAKETKTELIHLINRAGVLSEKNIESQFTTIKNKISYFNILKLTPLAHTVSVIGNKLDEKNDTFSKLIKENNIEIMNKINTLQKSIDLNNERSLAYVTVEEVKNLGTKIDLCMKLKKAIDGNNSNSVQSICKKYTHQKEIAQTLCEKKNKITSDTLLLRAKVLHDNPIIKNSPLIANFLYKDQAPNLHYAINSI